MRASQLRYKVRKPVHLRTINALRFGLIVILIASPLLISSEYALILLFTVISIAWRLLVNIQVKQARTQGYRDGTQDGVDLTIAMLSRRGAQQCDGSPSQNQDQQLTDAQSHQHDRSRHVL